MALIGACLAFLRYNFHPASIFLGDSGSMFIGFSLGAVALSSNVKGALVVSLAVPVLAAGVPALDTILAMWRRSARMLLRRSEGDSNGAAAGRAQGLMEADTDHLHHRLLRSGMSPGRAAMWFYAANGALIAVVLASMLFKSHVAAIYMMAFVAGFYVLVRHVAHVELWDTGQALLHGLKQPSRRVAVVLLYPSGTPPCLALAAAVVVLLTGAGPQPNRSEASIRQLPFWLGPTSFCSAWSRPMPGSGRGRACPITWCLRWPSGRNCHYGWVAGFSRFGPMDSARFAGRRVCVGRAHRHPRRPESLSHVAAGSTVG